MTTLRRYTREEWLAGQLVAHRLRAVDAELADLFSRNLDGDDSVIPAIYDRIQAIGRFDLADRVRALVAAKGDQP